MIYEGRSNSEKRGIEEKQKLLFCRYQQINAFCVQAFIFMKRQLYFLSLYEVLTKSWKF